MHKKMPALRHLLHVLAFTSEDSLSIQLDPTHVPSPKFLPNAEYEFNLPVNTRILYVVLCL